MSSTQQAIQLDGEAAEKALLERINSGQLIEDLADMTPRYRAVLERTLAIAAQGDGIDLGANRIPHLPRSWRQNSSGRQHSG